MRLQDLQINGTYTVHTIKTRISNNFLQQRRGNQCRHQRMELSKQIRKDIRKRLRHKRKERILREFVQLNRLNEVHHDPAKPQKIRCRRTTDTTDACGVFAGHIRAANSHIKLAALYQESWWKCQCSVVLDEWAWLRAAQSGKVMPKQWWISSWNVTYASVETPNCLLVKAFRIITLWRHNMFFVLSKTNNWRRTVVLLFCIWKLFEKFFFCYCIYGYVASWITNSLWAQLGLHRKQVLTMPSLCKKNRKTLEWQCGIWFASLDLRGGLDKVENGTIFFGTDYDCYFARRNDTQISGPQIPWQFES